MWRAIAVIGAVALAVAAAPAQQVGRESGEFDACGVLTRGSGCVLFKGGGGNYVVVNTGDFQFGDTVRVVGTLDTECITICPEADGCIRGAELYDPDVFPCGTPLPSLPGDIVNGVCAASGAGLLLLAISGMCLTRARNDEETLRPQPRR